MDPEMVPEEILRLFQQPMENLEDLTESNRISQNEQSPINRSQPHEATFADAAVETQLQTSDVGKKGNIKPWCEPNNSWGAVDFHRILID